MLNVTPRARAELQGVLTHALADHPRVDGPPDLGLRIVPGEGPGDALSLVLDEPRRNDEVVEHDGRSLLIVDAAIGALLDDLTLEIVETPDGTRLGLRDTEP